MEASDNKRERGMVGLPNVVIPSPEEVGNAKKLILVDKIINLKLMPFVQLSTLPILSVLSAQTVNTSYSRFKVKAQWE